MADEYVEHSSIPAEYDNNDGETDIIVEGGEEDIIVGEEEEEEE